MPPERDGPGSLQIEIQHAMEDYFEALETYKEKQGEAKRDADQMLNRLNALKREAKSGQMRLY